MSDFNGTGPQGQVPMSGRGRGRCRIPQTMLVAKPEIQNPETNEIIYGLGRGGKPRGGGGLGNRFGAGSGKVQGRGRGRSSGNS